MMMTVQQPRHHLRPRQLRPPPLPPHQPLRRSTMRWPCRSKLQQAAASCSKLQQATGSVFLPHSTTRRRGKRLQINYTRVLRVPLVQHSSSCSTVCASCVCVLQKPAKPEQNTSGPHHTRIAKRPKSQKYYGFSTNKWLIDRAFHPHCFIVLPLAHSKLEISRVIRTSRNANPQEGENQ